MLQTEFKLLKY